MPELPLVTRYTHQRGLALLIAVLMLLLALPLLESYPYGRAALAPLFLVAIALAVTGQPGRAPNWPAGLIAAVLSGTWLVARLADAVLPLGGTVVLRIAPLLGLTLTLLILASILRALAVARQVTRGIMAEAFTGYLILGIAFAELYGLLDGALPSAFSAVPPSGSAMTMFVYFSLGTLSSVGFGDIVPVHPFVRIVAALEGVCGLFYTAIVVARLVASSVRNRSGKSRYRVKAWQHPHR